MTEYQPLNHDELGMLITVHSYLVSLQLKGGMNNLDKAIAHEHAGILARVIDKHVLTAPVKLKRLTKKRA